MEVKVLGSVSPFPMGHRNCPGFLVTENQTRVLLDCGNGCTGLLSGDELENLIVIITHLHHDHYGDLSCLANRAYVEHKLGNLKNKIQVYIPDSTLYKLVSEIAYEDLEVHTVESLYLKRIPASYMEIKSYDLMHPIVLGNDLSLSFLKTIHSPDCYALRLDNYQDQSLVYSADTGYQEGFFSNFAKNADLFICESSFLQEQECYNIGNQHLFAYQAAYYARESNVDELMLTHFYPTVVREKYLEEAYTFFSNVSLAEEGKVKKLGVMV